MAVAANDYKSVRADALFFAVMPVAEHPSLLQFSPHYRLTTPFNGLGSNASPAAIAALDHADCDHLVPWEGKEKNIALFVELSKKWDSNQKEAFLQTWEHNYIAPTLQIVLLNCSAHMKQVRLNATGDAQTRTVIEPLCFNDLDFDDSQPKT